MVHTINTRSNTRHSSSLKSNNNVLTPESEEVTADRDHNEMTNTRLIQPRLYNSPDSRDNSLTPIYHPHIQNVPDVPNSQNDDTHFPMNSYLSPRTMKLRSPTKNNPGGTSTSSVNGALSRPESRCSQHSTVSITSSSIPVTRTTTSRRGGRAAARSRSPIPISVRSTERHMAKVCTPSKGYRTTPPRTVIPSSLPTPNCDIKILTKSMKKSEKSHEWKKREESDKEAIADVRMTETVSSVAAKAAAEAQRLWMNARENEAYTRGRGVEHLGRHPHVFERNEHEMKVRGERGKLSNYIDMERVSGDRNEQYRHNRQNVFRRQIDHGHKTNLSDVYPVDSSPNRSSRITTRSNNKIKRPDIGSGGTSLVMGTATPMHVPRASPDPKLLPKQKPSTESMSPSSELRFDDLIAPPGSPQRLLLDLKSGSRSFEVRSPLPDDDLALKSNHKPPLSPQEPPQIQHSHVDSNSFFFEPQKSPRTPKTPKTPKSPGQFLKNTAPFLGTPSFNNFFNNSDFDSFDDNENFNLPTPNPNSNSLLNEENDLRSPIFSFVRGIDGSSPRKTFSNSPLFEAFDSTFSPRQHTKDQFNVGKITDIMMEGAPSMPQVSARESKESEKDVKSEVPEFKSTPSQRPPKKRILEQEKRSPMRPLEVKLEIDSDPTITRMLIELSPNHEKNDEKIAPKIHHETMPLYRPPPKSLQNSHRPQPYHHTKYLVHKAPKMIVPSLAGMKSSFFYKRLTSHKEAFSSFTFLLPGLKNALTNAVTTFEMMNLSNNLSQSNDNSSQVRWK